MIEANVIYATLCCSTTNRIHDIFSYTLILRVNERYLYLYFNVEYFIIRKFHTIKKLGYTRVKCKYLLLTE